MNAHEKIYHPLLLLFVILMAISCSKCDDNDMWEDMRQRTHSFETESLTPHSEFPAIQEIVRNPAVQYAMKKAWQLTLDTASTKGRREIGFYIYYNFDAKAFYVGNFVVGPLRRKNPLSQIL